MRFVRKLAPTAPGWVNVRYLRSVTGERDRLDRRALLLSWVFADLLGQHAHGLTAADEGMKRFGGDLFPLMMARSARRLRWSMLPRIPGLLWRRLGLG
jgi:hypothetical protein